MTGEESCPLCHGAATEPAFTIGRFRLNRCPTCHLRFVIPSGGDDQVAYDQGYFDDGTATAYAGARARARRLKRLAPLVLELGPPPPGGAVFEVGAACGDFLFLMRERGWSVAGLEPSEYACRCAAERYGLRLAAAPLETYAPAAPFPLVVALDVFSHLRAPDRFFHQLRAWCAPGGRIVIQTGDADRLHPRRRAEQWHDPREHKVMIGRASLDYLTATYGLALERIDYPTVLDAGALAGVAGSFPSGTIRLTGRDYLKRVLLPLRPFLGGTAMRLWFRRK